MKYLRDTKNKGRSALLEAVWSTATCSGHLLDSTKPMTLAEIVSEHAQYDRSFEPEGFDYTPEQIAEGLAELVSAGLVKALPESRLEEITAREQRFRAEGCEDADISWLLATVVELESEIEAACRIACDDCDLYPDVAPERRSLDVPFWVHSISINDSGGGRHVPCTAGDIRERRYKRLNKAE